ncbi:MAG: radical SAM protein [Nanoarchaeota archaeon]|nr:radical SAM protein [Nanoarchaeota archaeon]
MNTRPRQPLDLAYIASLLLKNNYEVKFLDANVLKYDADKTVSEIKTYNPDILILTSSPVDRWECPNSYIDSVFEVINKAGIRPTILTGSHGSLTPERIFEKCDVDYIVRNEPEIIVSNLVEALTKNEDISKIKGVSHRVDDKIINNEDASRIENLDKLPFPAYELLPMDRYKYSSSDLPQPFSIMLTSRGCPFSCSFCLKTMSKGDYMVRSSENVVDEIEYLVKNFKIKSIFFQDWEFTINKKRVEQICDSIINKEIKVFWGCNARANDLSEELVGKMKKAGCVRINIGFESGSQKILDNINKGIKIKELEQAIKICRENNINIGMYAMVNLPGENLKTIKETVKFLKRNKIDSMTPNFPIPYFGTKIFEELKNKYKNTEFTWENIEDYAGKARTYLNPKLSRFYYRVLNFIRKKS